MQFECPECGSADLRYARLHGFREHALVILGIRPLRCRECRSRFAMRTWSLRGFFYAHCPRCWRRDLSRWSEDFYDVPLRRRFAIALGAHKLRCEYCRVNFVSFRPRMIAYRRRRTQPRKSAAGAGR